MSLSKRYDAAQSERRWQDYWARAQVYEFDPSDPRPIFAIDTPPPTVSGELHVGHVYSYVQAEAVARFWRMQGRNVYYPFGFDDNGLPTERFVERSRGIRARDMPRPDFIAACLEVSREVEDRFEALWRSLGFSVDWRLRYSTIDPQARRVSQWSFLDLHRKGRIYRAQAPNPWCVECQTAIAQAEIDDAERATTFYTIGFMVANGRGAAAAPGDAAKSEIARAAAAALDPERTQIPIATTRPELLPACVAVFVHPEDERYRALVGQEAIVPLSGRRVPILADPGADPQKGTGAVMCCTFGDAADVAWWRAHGLPLIPLVTRQGRLGEAGGPYAGLTLREARERILADLHAAGALAGERPAQQTVRIHERCKTPLEILETSQWFVRLLDAKEELLEAGRRITWRPAHMLARYEHWVRNLSWDWCISRQRFYGVPFPLWHCDACGAVVLADEAQLPVDPTADAPPRPCECGNAMLRPEEDVMDTWATSSVSPQIAGQMLERPELYARLFPMQLRPQAHDIIRTWAFYTIAKSHFHFGQIPWETVMISGHALDPSGHSIHKSLGNSPVAPAALLARHGADAVRYWACGGAIGADQPVNEEAMRQGARLVTKLWNASRFIELQLADRSLQMDTPKLQVASCKLQWSDRALLSWLQRLIARATENWRAYEYAAARDATERFFWATLCDNYLELVKGRLYDGAPEERLAAQQTLAHTLLALLKLLAPIVPHVTEEIYQQLFAAAEGAHSLHLTSWPQPDAALIDPEAERAGEALFAVAAAARRFKTARQLGMGTALARLTLATADDGLRAMLEQSATDLRSVTRAQELVFAAQLPVGAEEVAPGLWVAIEP
ncbi:MAG TPA: valine--tRNA ligase [Roseiflexaceae bacterium]|nr:valine--tRNA ligase [Roseiflexaceae bacterium]